MAKSLSCRVLRRLSTYPCIRACGAPVVAQALQFAPFVLGSNSLALQYPDGEVPVLPITAQIARLCMNTCPRIWNDSASDTHDIVLKQCSLHLHPRQQQLVVAGLQWRRRDL